MTEFKIMYHAYLRLGGQKVSLLQRCPGLQKVKLYLQWNKPKCCTGYQDYSTLIWRAGAPVIDIV